MILYRGSTHIRFLEILFRCSRIGLQKTVKPPGNETLKNENVMGFFFQNYNISQKSFLK